MADVLTKERVLIVDDKDINRLILKGILKNDYDVIEAANGQEAIEIIEKEQDNLSIVLLDIVMPVMDGFGVLEYIEKQGLENYLPVILITADDSDEVEDRGYQHYVADIIRKPFKLRVVQRRVNNVIELYNQKKMLEKTVDEQYLVLKQQNEELFNKSNALERTVDDLIDALSGIVEYRDSETSGHINRIKEYTRLLAEKLAEKYPNYLNNTKVDMVVKASAMHDIGKISVPDKVLLKPARLTDEEFDVIKRHSEHGEELIERFSFIEDKELYECCKQVCRSHHEKWDGRGYPDGLIGDDIPVPAQIVSVADVYDALTTKRCYKEAFEHEKVIEMIHKGECGQFNPILMECLDDVADDFKEILNKTA